MSLTNIISGTLFRDNKSNHPSFFIENRPIYMFNSELEKKDIKILKQVFQESSSCSKNPIIGENIVVKVIELRKICDGILESFQYNGNEKKYVISCLKSTEWAKPFETVIQLIPGGYNSSWKPLNGFFGMYFNQETSEISPIPPIVDSS
jgi:hypothetical protein